MYLLHTSTHQMRSTYVLQWQSRVPVPMDADLGHGDACIDVDFCGDAYGYFHITQRFSQLCGDSTLLQADTFAVMCTEILHKYVHTENSVLAQTSTLIQILRLKCGLCSDQGYLQGYTVFCIGTEISAIP